MEGKRQAEPLVRIFVPLFPRSKRVWHMSSEASSRAPSQGPVAFSVAFLSRSIFTLTLSTMAMAMEAWLPRLSLVTQRTSAITGALARASGS